MSTEQTVSSQAASKRGQAYFRGAVMIWAGLVFGAESLGLLPQIGRADAWSWVFFGAGLLALIGIARRALSPDRADPGVWDYIWAAVLLIIGLSGLTTLEIGGPLILVLIGLGLLGTALLRPST
jgi:hypothetical protein